MHVAELLQLRSGATDHRHDAVSILKLSPDIERFVREMSAAWARHEGLDSVSPAEARRIAEEVRRPWTRGGPAIASIAERRVAGVRVRFYEPRPNNAAALIYLHGGGWTLFSIDSHDRLMREYASRADVTVIGVDYALAPEARFPIAIEQIAAVAQSVRAQYAALAIGGDSAGANLSIATAMRAPLFDALLLNYGVFERHSSAEAIEKFGGAGNMLTADEMESFWRNYLRDERDAESPLACPMRGDLRGLPPTLLIVPENDLLTEQSFHLAEGLRDAGVETELKLYRGAVHSFLEAVAISPLADRAIEESASWLRARVGN